ncbi:glycosyltransferase [Paenibacillus sp. KQZ6P-2]|uniref:Glycosyltransferase n=1 Tax=Paenibacillus mangrovi TaxID=2931978 RepID=A0A9X1WRN1_9BACL|nr:glycosyltransferase [Paenibacillus mangrovi]MCJ8012685.1 glycosyltransferase [Paenibacillus mangrovi]
MEFTGERFIPNITDKELEIEHMQRYLSLTEIVRDKSVLDAACGEGYGSYFLSKSAKSVCGIDIDNQTIELAAEKYKQDNLSFEISGIDSLPFDDHIFDVLISFETLEHVDEHIQQKFLQEAKRVLKQDGILVISTPNKEYYSDQSNYVNPFHVKELYRDEFEALLSKQFTYVDIVSQRFEVVSLMDRADHGVEKREVHYDAYVESEIQEKYMIAFCSDVDSKFSEAESCLLYPFKYDEMKMRILTLQDEVEDRNRHICTLDEELNFLRKQYMRLEELEEKISCLHRDKLDLEQKYSEVEEEKEKLENSLDIQKRHSDSLKQQLTELLQENQKLKQDFKNKEGHIELLLVEERKLQRIYDSTGWSLLMSYYKLRDAIIPAKSKRRVLAKLGIKTLKNPKFMISKLNKGNIKKLKYYFKAEDASQLENRIETFIERNSGEESHPEIQIFANEDLKHLKFDYVENPLVSIIIPVYNQWNYTYSCLASILENTKDTSYEVIIADDMSTDETIDIQNYVDNVRVVRDGVNRGFLLNCNNAARQARGKYIFFLNNDTNVQPEWLSSLVHLIESNSKIGMVGSKLIYPDGRQQEAGGIIWEDASGWNYGRLDDPEKPEYNYVKEVDYISGAAILVRHDLWKEIGGFDERFVPAYFEDSDLAFEVRKLGYKVLLQPRSVVVHFEGISHGTDLGSGIKSYQVQNKEKFLNKWNSVLTHQHFPNAEHVFWARDRSRDKKTVVIVDHYVPHYDKDAGGRCTYFYIRLMISMGLHVIFIGDNFYRHEPYTTELQQMGVEVLYGNDYAKNINKWIKANGQYLDYVYLNRPHISIKYMDVFKKHTNAKIIYFGHDLHYLREMRNYEITKNPSVLKSAEEWKETESKLFEMADVIHVVGSFEQQVLLEQFPDKPIRNIPLFPYSQPYGETHSINAFEGRKDLLFVGGFNHKPNFDGIMWFIKDVFPKIRNEIEDIKLFIVGSNPPEELKEMQSEQIVIAGYVSDQELEEYYNRCRVVVVPLRFGAGVKGKVVEALNYQVPIVTTSIGAEGLENIKDVLAVSDDKDHFATSVINLYLNEELWNASSKSSGGYIKKYFTIDAAKRILSLDIEN